MDVRRVAAFAVLFVVWAPASAQHVYKCVNWQGAVTYQSERCPEGHRIDRTYDTNREIEVGGRVVRNFVPTTGGSPDALSPTYGRVMDTNGRVKSDALCEPVRAAVNGARGHRTIESIRANASVVSQLCNHSRGPGR